MSEAPRSDQQVDRARPATVARDPSCLGRAGAFGIAVVGIVYLLNPGWGILELIPDNVAGIGNLDEAGATTAVILALRTLFRRKGPTKP